MRFAILSLLLASVANAQSVGPLEFAYLSCEAQQHKSSAPKIVQQPAKPVAVASIDNELMTYGVTTQWMSMEEKLHLLDSLKKGVKQPIPPLYNGRNTTAHVTYPGELTTHLSGHHRKSIAGMTSEEMLDLHDSLHPEIPGTKYSWVQQATQSNCPGGVCPLPQQQNQTRYYSTPRVGIFGRRK